MMSVKTGLVRNADALVNEVHEPGGAHQKKLEIFEEGGFLSLDLVAHELKDPGDDEDEESNPPYRDIESPIQKSSHVNAKNHDRENA